MMDNNITKEIIDLCKQSDSEYIDSKVNAFVCGIEDMQDTIAHFSSVEEEISQYLSTCEVADIRGFDALLDKISKLPDLDRMLEEMSDILTICKKISIGDLDAKCKSFSKYTRSEWRNDLQVDDIEKKHNEVLGELNELSKVFEERKKVFVEFNKKELERLIGLIEQECINLWADDYTMLSDRISDGSDLLDTISDNNDIDEINKLSKIVGNTESDLNECISKRKIHIASVVESHKWLGREPIFGSNSYYLEHNEIKSSARSKLEYDTRVNALIKRRRDEIWAKIGKAVLRIGKILLIIIGGIFMFIGVILKGLFSSKDSND